MKTININELLKTFPPEKLITDHQIEIIDVRTPNEYRHEHIKAAKNIPLENLNELDQAACQSKIAIFHCRSGHRTEMNRVLLEKTPFKEK